LPSPATWLEVLGRRLDDQAAQVGAYCDYYDGAHRLSYVTAKWTQTFGSMFGTLADNWCQIVVDAAVERLTVEGFRFGPDENADSEAWGIWQENALDADAKMAHREAIKTGRAYALVSPPPRDGETPLITVEHPSQVVVAHAPGNRRVRTAALKRWVDDDGYAYATLYLPDGLYKWRSADPVRDGRKVQWVRRNDDPGGSNPLRVVPIVPLYNRPSMIGGGQSDLDPAIPLQDAINKTLADMLIASEFGAFPQRVLTGLEVPKYPDGHPKAGQVVSGFELDAAISRVWVFGNENVKATEFSAADLDNYVAPMQMMIHHLAAQTRTPPHYLLGEIVNASGDALKAAEAGLVARVRDKQVDFSDPWEEVMRLAFSLRGNAQRARATDAETIWRDPENRTEAEKTDAALKQQQLGVPREVLWARLGYSPQEISRMRDLPAPPVPVGQTLPDA
jgi:Phage portal protein, SPP1 Gp6-like